MPRLPEKPGPELCIRCQEAIFKGLVIPGEWAHWHGDHWCHDRYGNYTLTPLQEATPAYHGTEDVL